MRGGSASSIAIESKVFTVAVEGGNILRLTQKKGESRLSLYFDLEGAKWLRDSLREFWYQEGEPSWVRRRREPDRSFFISLDRNLRGRFLRIVEVIGGGTRTVVIPEGRRPRAGGDF